MSLCTYSMCVMYVYAYVYDCLSAPDDISSQIWEVLNTVICFIGQKFGQNIFV